MYDNLIKRIMRKKEVLGVVGVSDTTLWRWERAGIFPKRRRLGGNSIGWLSEEVYDFLDGLKAQEPTVARCNAIEGEAAAHGE